MMQLSGGEKALTAIALLFAIQNLKPSPFCLLDEIEAALDDSNVDRFAKYLHKLIKYTQFIVITHRRGTMVAADRLYGITMQEKGVSTLVSVNLIEEDLESYGQRFDDCSASGWMWFQQWRRQWQHQHWNQRERDRLRKNSYAQIVHRNAAFQRSI